MDTIIKLNLQLEKLKSLFIKDFKNKSVYNYYVIEDRGEVDEFLSNKNLISFITLYDIKNTIVFNEIINNCYAIIHISKFEFKMDNTIVYRQHSNYEQVESKKNYPVLDFLNIDDVFNFPNEDYKHTEYMSYRGLWNFEVDFDFYEEDNHCHSKTGPLYNLKDLAIICEQIISTILSSFPNFNFIIEENKILYDSYTYFKKESSRSTYLDGQGIITKFPLKTLSIQDLKYIPNFPNISLLKNNSLPNEINTSHYHIFKFNSFPIWQSMFIEFGINKKSRTDIKFMYDVMKHDGYIHKTVSQRDMLDWVFDNYNLRIDKTNNFSKTPTRMNGYENAINNAN